MSQTDDQSNFEETKDESTLTNKENQGFSLPDERKVTSLSEDKWMLESQTYIYLLTITVSSGRLKITLNDTKEYRVPLNTYSYSWTYSELIEKNQFFKLFDNITYIEDIIKSLVEHPKRFKIIGKSDDPEIIFEFTLPTRNNPKLELTLPILEKHEGERKNEEIKAIKFINEKMEELEQAIFNLSVELKEVTDKNHIEWNVSEFPEDVLQRLQKKWIELNPNTQPPWLQQVEEK